jgi:hypothetical protein
MVTPIQPRPVVPVAVADRRPLLKMARREQQAKGLQVATVRPLMPEVAVELEKLGIPTARDTVATGWLLLLLVLR